METVIAIGVLVVLLTGFLAVFTPAAQGIQRSIDSQQADRLATTLERELVTFREDADTSGSAIPSSSGTPTGFDKAFDWILNGNSADQAIIVYQYRASTTAALRADGSPEPQIAIDGEPGETYTVQTMARRLDVLLDARYEADLRAAEGPIFFVKTKQLVFRGGELTVDQSAPANSLQFLNTNGGLESASDPDSYLEAVITFSAEFYSIPSRSRAYLENQFTNLFNNAKNPVFTRNLAVRR